MSYFDGFVIPVRITDREAFQAHERKWWPFFKNLGALTLVAGWADDLDVNLGFQRSVDLRPGETVVFCWMVWPDKATRDRAHDQMMAHPEELDSRMPFDDKRMVSGGFAALLDES